MSKFILITFIFFNCLMVSAQIPVVPLPVVDSVRFIDNKGTLSTLTFSKETIGFVFAAGHTDGVNPGLEDNLYALNATISRSNTGRYTVLFPVGNPHPNGNDYPITLGVQEDGNRDGRIIQVVRGTQSATGFSIMILTGDNGGTPDTYVDEDWYFSVPATMEVVTDIEIKTN